jgi:hypothetical protein
MRKHVLWILPIIFILLSGCARPTSEINANLGEKFSLAIGQSASIRGENLKIRFMEVTADSRCPQGVTCIWAGEASSLIEITYSGTKYSKVLTQPGLSEPPRSDFQQYEITFDLQPYPQGGGKTESKDYRLQLEISRKAS